MTMIGTQACTLDKHVRKQKKTFMVRKSTKWLGTADQPPVESNYNTMLLGSTNNARSLISKKVIR